MRPNPTVGDISGPLAQDYNSNCNALQMVFQKQFRVVFRAELYSALNHPFFMVPSNTEALYTGLDHVHYVNPPVVASNYLSSFTNIPSGTISVTRTVQLGVALERLW